MSENKQPRPEAQADDSMLKQKALIGGHFERLAASSPSPLGSSRPSTRPT